MLISKEQLVHVCKTIDRDCFNEIGVLLETTTPQDVRRQRVMNLIKPIHEGIVSDEVLETTESIFREFTNQLQNIVSDNIPSEKIIINTKIGQKNISFTLSWTRVDNRDQMADPTGYSVYRWNGENIIATVGFTIFKKLTPSAEYRLKIKDTILHELNHIFENMMTGHPYYNVEIGSISQANLNSSNMAKRMLAYILYASHEGEQNAMCAELYTQLVRNDMHRPKTSAAYEWLEKLYIAHDYIIKHRNSQELNDAIKEYSINKNFLNVANEFDYDGLPIPRTKKPFDIQFDYRYFKRRADKGIKRFEQRIAQTLKKANKQVFGRLYCNNKKYYSQLF